MRKKLLAVLACLTLILGQSLTVSAASTDLPIFKSNSYIYSQVGGGHTSIPYLSLQTTK